MNNWTFFLVVALSIYCFSATLILIAWDHRLKHILEENRRLSEKIRLLSKLKDRLDTLTSKTISKKI